MALLTWICTLALVGCYAPALLDCAVICNDDRDCARGQVCGDDHLCAVSEVAGSCAATDAPIETQLFVNIVGKGRIVVDGYGTCDPEIARSCTFTVRRDHPIVLHAVPHDDWKLDHWSSACTGADPNCTLAPVEPTLVGSTFKKST